MCPAERRAEQQLPFKEELDIDLPPWWTTKKQNSSAAPPVPVRRSSAQESRQTAGSAARSSSAGLAVPLSVRLRLMGHLEEEIRNGTWHVAGIPEFPQQTRQQVVSEPSFCLGLLEEEDRNSIWHTVPGIPDLPQLTRQQGVSGKSHFCLRTPELKPRPSPRSPPPLDLGGSSVTPIAEVLRLSLE
eukprot:TRINITY_DN425_c0_g1_i3.p1 TRINITY_DN425_c0_g1~~TRINITY_DN425_c0_g1_i3.p1  ORF type:complete len:186 (+),score=34.23 TRINITY_DN425_c0_g1_i3:133-690(+)